MKYAPIKIINKLVFFCSTFAFLILIIIAGCTKTSTTSSSLPTIQNDNDKAVGASANNFLSANKYTSVKIEIQYMPGFAPDAASLNNLVTKLNSLTNKPDGITLTQSQIVTGGQTIESLQDVATIEKANRTVFTSGTQLGVYMLITDGNYSTANVLGFAYRNTSICLFGKTINDNSGAFGQTSRTTLTSTVVEHEMGHLLGLVNLGSAMVTNHIDTPHGNHCNNSNCLMYYQSETTDILGSLIAGNVPVLDANCSADLKANGGK